MGYFDFFKKKIFDGKITLQFYAVAIVRGRLNQMANEQTNGLTEADIAEAASNPASFSVEGLSQSNRSVSELIAADKYLRGRRLMSRGGSPFSALVHHAICPGPSGRF